MKTYKIIILSFFYFFTINTSAQQELTQAQKIEFQNRVKQKVEEFQHGLSNIVNKQLRHDIRKENVENVLKLFIGEGDPYYYYDEEADQRVKSKGVRMQTSSKRNIEHNQWQLLKSYIYKLYNPITGKSSLPYTSIKIESASAVRVDNIVRVGDHYECVAYFSQKFIGFNDGRVWYSDVTSKKIRCYINRIDLPTGKHIYDAKLGDIYVLKTI